MSKTHSWIILLLISMLTFSACQQKAAKSNSPEKKVVTKQKSPVNKTAKAKPSIKSKLNLTDQQMQRISRIQKSYQAKIQGFKKQKKWAGDKNTPTRKQTNDAKQKELKAVLGSKYEQYRKIVSTPKKKPKAQKK